VAHEVRKVRTEIGAGEAEEIPLAAKAGPLREDGEGKDLAGRERRRTSRLAWRRRMNALLSVFHEHVQEDEHGFEVHGPPPSAKLRGGGGRGLTGQGRTPRHARRRSARLPAASFRHPRASASRHRYPFTPILRRAEYSGRIVVRAVQEFLRRARTAGAGLPCRSRAVWPARTYGSSAW
jgi:hypothetical protein